MLQFETENVHIQFKIINPFFQELTIEESNLVIGGIGSDKDGSPKPATHP